MYFRLMGKLNARRNGLLSEEEKGFTLIELLVVVIIIGILAAIAIPVYLSVQKNSQDSAVQTDVTNLKTAIVSAETDLNAVPDAPATAWTDNTFLTAFPAIGTTNVSTNDWQTDGATFSKYTSSLTYVTTTAGFTICAESSNNTWYQADQSNGVSKATDGSACAGS